MKYNLVIGIILLILSSLIGIEISKKYKKRTLFFKDFEEFNQILINEMSFSRLTIPEIIKKEKIKDSQFYKVLNDKYLLKIKDIEKISYLSENEYVFFTDYVDAIGKNSLDYAKSVKERLNNLTKQVILDENKKKPLVIKVSFMIGVILLIALL